MLSRPILQIRANSPFSITDTVIVCQFCECAWDAAALTACVFCLNWNPTKISDPRTAKALMKVPMAARSESDMCNAPEVGSPPTNAMLTTPRQRPLFLSSLLTWQAPLSSEVVARAPDGTKPRTGWLSWVRRTEGKHPSMAARGPQGVSSNHSGPGLQLCNWSASSALAEIPVARRQSGSGISG